jgi:hypothetical protein
MTPFIPPNAALPLAVAHAIHRIDERCRQAEEEYPKLAAPDGTVAVQIDDLRAFLNAYDQLLLDLAASVRIA